MSEYSVSFGRDSTLLCGEVELSWRRFTALSRFLQLSGWATSLRWVYNESQKGSPCLENGLGFTRRWVGKGPVGGKIHSIHEVQNIINTHYTDQGPLPMNQDTWYHWASHLISILRDSQFEDHRDHINGCLGMLSRILPPGFANPIVPDYEKKVEEVFTSTAAMMLTNSLGLSELSRVEDRQYQRCHSLPSWVPDYSVSQQGDLNVGRDGNGRPSPDVLGDAKDNVSPGNTNEIPPTIRQLIIIGSSLIVHGTRINSIDTIGLRNPWDLKGESFDENLSELI